LAQPDIVNEIWPDQDFIFNAGVQCFILSLAIPVAIAALYILGQKGVRTLQVQFLFFLNNIYFFQVNKRLFPLLSQRQFLQFCPLSTIFGRKNVMLVQKVTRRFGWGFFHVLFFEIRAFGKENLFTLFKISIVELYFF
jgi:hypothetical protein